MIKGTAWSEFRYGADRQRVIQIRSDGATIQHAGAFEVETKNSVTKVKTYWPLGLGVEIEESAGTKLRWVHKDRLGSVVAISDEAGTVLESMSYDSWGRRRSLSGDDATDALDGVIENKGYTGHEMLDQLDLVHMNGRVYEPTFARFASADPIIQNPEHSQSYNRYTYVWNNPTNLTDPTGFMADSAGPRRSSGCGLRCQYEKEIKEQLGESSCLNSISFGCIFGAMTDDRVQKRNGKDKTGGPQFAPRTNEPDPTEADRMNGLWKYRQAVTLNSVKLPDGKTQEIMVLNILVFDDADGRGAEAVPAINEGYSRTSRDGLKRIDPRLKLTTDDAKSNLVIMNNGASVCMNPAAAGCAQIGSRVMSLHPENQVMTRNAGTRYGRELWKFTYKHEFGHNLGLGHRPNSVPSIMNYRTMDVTDRDIQDLFELYR